ncbi:MAG: hypothetical protein AAFW97_04995 [Pseudomonadota bacterium]
MTIIRAALAPLLALLLTGCLLVPGQFEAEMTIAADGAFDFAYRGEVRIGGDENRGAVAPSGDGGARGDAPESGSVDPQFEEAVAAFMGGLNPNNEETVVAFAERLEARRGWNSVDYRGEGLFDVDFATSGTLDRDFLFPVVPDFILNFPMVAAVPRDDGTVRITILALMPEPNDDGQAEPGPIETIGNGTFTLVTTAPIVSTNGTVSEGDNAGEMIIRWSSDDPPGERPEAIIQLER